MDYSMIIVNRQPMFIRSDEMGVLTKCANGCQLCIPCTQSMQTGQISNPDQPSLNKLEVPCLGGKCQDQKGMCLLHEVETAMKAKGIDFSSAPFTGVSPHVSPTAVHRRNSSVTKPMITSLSFAILSNGPEYEDVVGVIEDLVSQQHILMAVLGNDITNLDASLQPLDDTDQDMVVVSFQEPEHATLFRNTLEPLLRGTQYSIADARSPSPGKAARNLNLDQSGDPLEEVRVKPIDIGTGDRSKVASGDATPLYGAVLAPAAAALAAGVEKHAAPGKKPLSPISTSSTFPPSHTTSTCMLFVSPISISEQWRITIANPTDTSTVGGSIGTQGNALGTVVSGALSGGMLGTSGLGVASTGTALSLGSSVSEASPLTYDAGIPFGAGSFGAPTGNAFVTVSSGQDICMIDGGTGTHGNATGTAGSGALSGDTFGTLSAGSRLYDRLSRSADVSGVVSTGAAVSFGSSVSEVGDLASGTGNLLGAGPTGALTGNALGAAPSDKGKEAVETNTAADPSNPDNQRKRKAEGNVAMHTQLMRALLHPPTEIVVKLTIPPSLFPAPEIYDAFTPIYDEARQLHQAVLDRSNQWGLFCLSLRTISNAKFLPFHFLIGNLLDTKPVGLYIHSPNTDPSALAWDWQIHWIKLYFKSESEANTVFHMVTKQNAQLKSTMPKIPNWEVTDPLGNLIRNPNATETQQQAESPWLITIRTPLLVPRGKYYCCPQTPLQNTQYTQKKTLFPNAELNLLSPGSGCPLQAGTGHGRPGRAPGRC